MQRQSLGYPTSKLHIHGEEITGADDQKRRVIIDCEDRKESKPRPLSFSPSSPSLSSPPNSEKLIHLIPVLTLLCFLVLFLNSHSPSQSDLVAFNGFKHSSKRLGIMSFQLTSSLGVVPVSEKLREGRLRWFGHVLRRLPSDAVRRVESITVDGVRRRGRPRRKWEDCLRSDMMDLAISEDMTSDRKVWRLKTRVVE